MTRFVHKDRRYHQYIIVVYHSKIWFPLKFHHTIPFLFTSSSSLCWFLWGGRNLGGAIKGRWKDGGRDSREAARETNVLVGKLNILFLSLRKNLKTELHLREASNQAGSNTLILVTAWSLETAFWFLGGTLQWNWTPIDKIKHVLEPFLRTSTC